MKGSCKKLCSNLLRQNVYVRDVVAPYDEKCDYHIDRFSSVDYQDVPGACREVVTGHDYPITPDSVNSYADSCNYKVDPMNVPLTPRGENLGDLTFMQKLMDMDSSERDSFLEGLKSRLSASEVLSQTVDSSVKNEEKNEEEVK